jgi:hypothetical protein
MVNGILVQQSQGIWYHVKAAWYWSGDSSVGNNLFRASGSTPYQHLPPVLGSVGDGFYSPFPWKDNGI